MTTTTAAVATMAVLASAGVLPVVALVGLRPVALPLCPLGGAVIAAMAATAFVGVGGSLLVWFVLLTVLCAAGPMLWWQVRPDRRPWSVAPAGRVGQHAAPSDRTPPCQRPRQQAPPDRTLPDPTLPLRTPLWFGVAAGSAVVLACIWCLRGLATPTVGFDARAVWLTRAGWFLQSHGQLLVKLKVPDVVLTQSAYPPLVSAATAVGWRVTGDHSVRLGVVTVALLSACALLAAVSALVEAGRSAVFRYTAKGPVPAGAELRGARRTERVRVGVRTLPMAVGAVCAVLLVFVAFGVTEPFITNGYADPIWSLAAVGAVAYGLQLDLSRANRGAAVVLLLAAGLSKDEGVATAVGLLVLIAVRQSLSAVRQDTRRAWRVPVVVAVLEMVAIGAWPLLMRIVHAREQAATHSPVAQWGSRADASFRGMAPYLHVVVLAAAAAVIGGLVLSGVRERIGLARDGWAWSGLAWGFVTVWAGLVVGAAPIVGWLATTVHRVTEFTSLLGWWIVAMWAVVGSAAVVSRSARPPHGSDDGSDDGSDGGSDGGSDRSVDVGPAGPMHAATGEVHGSAATPVPVRPVVPLPPPLVSGEPSGSDQAVFPSPPEAVTTQ